MTWHYDRPTDGWPVTIYDHTGAAVRTIPDRPRGLTIPGDILRVMEAEVMAEGISGGLSDRQIAILRDAVFENIERGPPP